jgi:hypothetical protein
MDRKERLPIGSVGGGSKAASARLEAMSGGLEAKTDAPEVIPDAPEQR